jgi:hypothetical protein
MAQWEDFNHIFSFNKKYSYDAKVVDQIISNRKALENQLFADRLLGLAGITGGKGNESVIDEWKDGLTPFLSVIVTKVYPPRSNADLRSLIEHIVSSELDIHHKQALVYYILKDCRSAPEAAPHFAQDCHLPEKYRLFIEGIWNLDRLEFRVRFPLLLKLGGISNYRSAQSSSSLNPPLSQPSPTRFSMS